MSQTCKILFLLDLDHTVIYGSFAPAESATKLFQYHQYLAIYERPFARELIDKCNKYGHIIVYTTALRKYAKLICNELTIKPIEILSRKNCQIVNGIHTKMLREDWLIEYDTLIIIDDSPNVWRNTPSAVKFWVPSEFRGDQIDKGLLPILTELDILNNELNNN
jgi:hypothetical protein